MARPKNEEVKAPKAKAPKEDKAVKGLKDNPKSFKEHFDESVDDLREGNTKLKEEFDPKIVLTGKTTPEMEKAFTEVFPTGVIKTAESFLISKGIDPPMKDSPLNGQNSITFNQLCELLNEFKNA